MGPLLSAIHKVKTIFKNILTPRTDLIMRIAAFHSVITSIVASSTLTEEMGFVDEASITHRVDI